jgi:hypothetical protein
MVDRFFSEMEGPQAVALLNSLDKRAIGTAPATGSGTINLDISQDPRSMPVTLTTGATTINLTGNGVALGDASLVDLDQKQILIPVIQSTGGVTPTLGAGFHFGTDLTSVTFSTAAGAKTYLCVVYDHANSRCDVLGTIKGF